MVFNDSMLSRMSGPTFVWRGLCITYVYISLVPRGTDPAKLLASYIWRCWSPPQKCSNGIAEVSLQAWI